MGVRDLTSVAEICVGYSHSCARHSDGRVSCWGAPYLGAGTVSEHGRLTPVEGLSNAVALSCGGSFSCALLETGRIRCWGSNGDAVLGSFLGNGTTLVALTPVEVDLPDAAVPMSTAGAIEETFASASRWTCTASTTPPR